MIEFSFNQPMSQATGQNGNINNNSSGGAVGSIPSSSNSSSIIPKVLLKRLYWTQIDNNDLQPFSIIELQNTRSNQNGSGETYGDLCVGCGGGALNVYDVRSTTTRTAPSSATRTGTPIGPQGSEKKSQEKQQKHQQQTGNTSTSNSNSMMSQQITTQPESLVEKRRITLHEKEPITHMAECEGSHQRNMIVFCTLNGFVYLINHHVKTCQIKVNLALLTGSPGPQNPISNLNIVHWMGFYGTFCKERNPLLVIHDLKNGLYMLNLVTHQKTNIMQWKSSDHGQNINNNNKSSFSCLSSSANQQNPILKKRKSDQNSSSSDDDDYYAKEELMGNGGGSGSSGGADLNDPGSRFTSALGLMTSQNPIHQAQPQEIGQYWLTRYQNCAFCPLRPIPSASVITIMHQTRQILVVFQNVVQVVCYEAPDPVKMRSLMTTGSDADFTFSSPLPLEHQFKFEEVQERVALLRSITSKNLTYRSEGSGQSELGNKKPP